MLTPSDANKKIRFKALNYLMFLKGKRCGKVKARGCADGRPQSEYISKDESSSLTVSIYALMTSCLMDAVEGRKVAACDIPGAFLQADWPTDRDCYLKFEGAMVSMICDIDHKYKKNIVHGRNGKKYIYAKLSKAVYGTLLGAILFYEKLSKQLIEWGWMRCQMIYMEQPLHQLAVICLRLTKIRLPLMKRNLISSIVPRRDYFLPLKELGRTYRLLWRTYLLGLKLRINPTTAN
jgi:hypothetical protein